MRDTFTRSILNIAAELESMREAASQNEGKLDTPDMGPRVVVVGPPGSGRSTIAMTLLNYGARLRPQVYVDLDVRRNDISVSGMVSAVVAERPVVVTRGYGTAPVLSFAYGDLDLSRNAKLYQLQIIQLLKNLEARDEAHTGEAKCAGWIIKAPTFDSQQNYKDVLDALKLLDPHVVIVLGYDRLVSDLNDVFEQRISQKKTQIVNLTRSGGIIHHGPLESEISRQLRVRDYFYGPSRELGPARISLPYGEKFVVVQLKLQDQISITAMPIDHEAPQEAELEVIQVTPDRTLRHHLLAVSYAQSIEQVLFSNVAGYLHVLDVDTEKGKLVCTSPLERILIGAYSGPIYLIQTELKFTDVE